MATTFSKIKEETYEYLLVAQKLSLLRLVKERALKQESGNILRVFGKQLPHYHSIDRLRQKKKLNIRGDGNE